MRAVIFLGGTYGDPQFYENELREDDFLIAADGGCEFLKKLGKTADIAIGDFDTISEKEVLAKEIIKLPREKDFTDSQEAVRYALSRGFSEIVLMGALGERMDHSLCNLYLLDYAKKRGAKIHICDEKNIVYITDDYIKIPKKEGYYLSLVQLTEVLGLTLSGLYYPLKEKNLGFGDIVGISNEFTDDFCEVSLKKGTVLLMLSKD